MIVPISLAPFVEPSKPAISVPHTSLIHVQDDFTIELVGPSPRSPVKRSQG